MNRRPDLIDYKACLKKSARDNLESMFTITERELGVTRILDPEDVDTSHPDEKSLITYISMLYELFPDPNPRNPLHDDEKIRQIEEYRESASRMIRWLNDTINKLRDRNWPTTVQELRMIQTDLERFRSDEIPHKLNEKQRLQHAWREISRMASEISNPIHLDHEISADNIDILWNRMIACIHDREQALIDEIHSLEKLQRLADKLLREIKLCDSRLDEIDRSIIDEAKRIERLDPRDAKFNCDAIAADLKIEGERINNMMADVQILLDNRYHRSSELQIKVEQLHQRWTEMGFIFKTKIVEAITRKISELENDSKKRAQIISNINDYTDEAKRLISWITKSTSMLKERNWSDNLDELKSLQQDHLRFKNRDVPSKLSDKQKLSTAWREVTRQAMSLDKPITLDDDTSSDHIDILWNRMLAASQEREAALNSDIDKLQQLDRLAEQISRDIKSCSSRLDDIEHSITEEAKRIERMDPRETKFNVDHIASDIKIEGDRINKLFNDVRSLTDAGYSKASDLRIRVEQLHKRWLDLNTSFKSKVVDAIARKLAQLEDSSKRRAKVTNDINDYTEQARRLISWIIKSTNQLKERNWPNDLDQVQSLQAQHQRFKNNEITSKSNDKSKLSQIYREIQRANKELDQPINIDHEVSTDAIETHWNRLMAASNDRESALADEIRRLEKLETLADKLRKDIKSCDVRLDDIENKITEESRKIERMDPHECKLNAERITSELKSQGETITALYADARVLTDGKYNKATEIRTRIDQLHSRWSDLGVTFKSRILDAIDRKIANLQENAKQRAKVEQDIDKYTDTAKRLLSWINKSTSTLNLRDWDDNNANEIRILQKELEQFQSIDVPPKSSEKSTLTSEWRELSRRANDFNPSITLNHDVSSDVLDSAWGKLMNAIDDRSRDLSSAVSKLDKLASLHASYSRSFEDLAAWIDEMNSRLDRLKNLSIHEDKLRIQIEEIEEINEEIIHHEKVLDEIEDTAQTYVDLSTPHDASKIRIELEDLQNKFGSLSNRANECLSRAQHCLKIAKKFWDEMTTVMATLKEISDTLSSQETPALEPEAISHQQQILTEIRQEIESTESEVIECRSTGKDLMRICSDNDKLEVKRHIEDLDTAWETVTSLYAKREATLADAMEKAMNFHELLQSILDFLDLSEHKFENLGPISTDIDTVKQQMMQLRDFKNEIEPHVVDIENVNRKASQLMENANSTQIRAVSVPIEDINRRWDELNRGICERQSQLERALLSLGQFQHALDELLTWIDKAERTVNDVKPSFADQQVIEMDLAKLKVTINDMEAHQSSVDSLNQAGRKLIESGGPEALTTSSKLNDLNTRWNQLRSIAMDKQRQLEKMLRDVQNFSQEISDLMAWLTEVESQLVSSKPVGGLPETAREQLNKFLELYSEIDSNKSRIETTLTKGHDLCSSTSHGSTNNLQHSLKSLKQRWDHILNKANDRKIKLEIALREATEFHEALQEFIEWLTSSEQYLNNASPVSRVLATVTKQIDEHKNFTKDVTNHRETILALDKKGTHLKYFSQKQDVILIKNMMISVQHRWERVVSKSAERTRSLDNGLKEAKEFNDSWIELINWLKDAEKSLDDVNIAGNAPEKIRAMLIRHKEFQRALGSKQGSYDSTMKCGRTLKDKAPRSDVPILQEMIDELKSRWNSVCAKSVDRQRKLEESLLYSGQFKEAVDALLDWLERARNDLLSIDRLHGDLDTVTQLVEQHKSFQEDLKSRNKQLSSVRKTATELLSSAAPEDASIIRSQMSTVESKWDEVSRLSIEKEHKLTDALRQAEQLHKSVHSLLEWLSDAEMKLRCAAALPDDEEGTRMQLNEYRKVREEMSSKVHEKDRTISLAQDILSKCHPDAVSTVNHWISIIQSRWEELSNWLKSRESKLEEHLASLRDITDLLDGLMSWLKRKESDLHAVESTPLPDDIPSIERLIDEHQIFIDDLSSRKHEVDHIHKVFSVLRKQPEESIGRTSRTKGRWTPSKSRASSAAASAPETEIRNPRARELLDKWSYVWNLAQDRMKRLQERLGYFTELERIKNFDFEEWRRRFLAWINNKKARIMDFYRKIDTDNDCKVTQNEFIEGFLKSSFPTSRLEMERVAPIFDRNGDGYIDHKEYLETLRAQDYPKTDDEIIQDEVQKQVAKCTCTIRYKVFHVGEGKYRFGESQKLRLVRILRSTVMVRVGGGWVSLDEFLLKNDPCRGKLFNFCYLSPFYLLIDYFFFYSSLCTHPTLHLLSP